ncbi:MAG: tetratricopeptide repeat protein, partial [Methanosarcinaceae archaeon]
GIMVVLAYRPEEIARSDRAEMMMEAITNMIREDAVDQIELGRLSRDEVSDLLCTTFDLEEVPKTFLDRVYDRTEGNPFFVQEVLRGLVNEGVIDMAGYTWLNQVDMNKVSIPSTLEEMVSRRIARLSPEVLKVLKYASIIGLQFNFKHLLALVDRPEEEVLDALDELIDQRLVHEEGGSDEETYRFDNAIIRDLAYASLSKSRKRLIHNKIGEILEAEYKDDISPIIFDLAYHFDKGKEFRKALYYMIKAGEGASVIYAYHEALNYFSDANEALGHLESSDGNTQIREGLLFNIGYCEETLGDWDSALEDYNRAQQLTTHSRHMKLHGQILRHIGDVHRRKGDYGLADINYKNAVTAARIAKDYHTLAESYRGLGYISWRRGRYSKATKEYESSIKYARKIKDHSVIAVIFIEVGNLYNSKGQSTKALDHYHRALDILERSGDMFDITRAYNNIGDVYLGREDYGKAVEFFRQSERYARKVGNINMAYWALFNTAEAFAKLGELEKAMDLCKTAEAGLRKQDDKIGISYTNMVFGIIHGKMGDLKSSRSSFDESIRALKSMDVPEVLGEVLCEKGQVLLDVGEKESGKAALKEALRLFDSVNAKHRSGKVQLLLNEA